MRKRQPVLAKLEDGLAICVRLRRSQKLSWLSEGYLAEDGFKTLAGAFTYINETLERYREAELCRIKGNLLLLPGGNESKAK